MRQRITEELALLREAFPAAQHAEVGGEEWFFVPDFALPDGWQIAEAAIDRTDIAFKLLAGYPTTAPYGFVATAGINFNGTPPGNPGSPVQPPFAGQWQHFSWAPDEWQPKANVREGANILSWVRGIKERFAAGA